MSRTIILLPVFSPQNETNQAFNEYYTAVAKTAQPTPDGLSLTSKNQLITSEKIGDLSFQIISQFYSFIWFYLETALEKFAFQKAKWNSLRELGQKIQNETFCEDHLYC